MQERLRLHISRPNQLRRPAVRLAMPGLLVLLLLAVTATLQPTPAAANPATTTTSLILQGEAKTQVSSLRTEAEKVQKQIDELDHEIEILTEKHNGLTVELEDLNKQLAQIRRDLGRAEANHDYRTSRLEERLRRAYKNGDHGFLEVVLATDDFADFVRRFILFLKVAERDADLAAGFDQSATEIAHLQEDFVSRKREAMTLKAHIEKTRGEIEQRLHQRENRLDSLDEEIARVIEEERARQEAERLRLEAELRARLAAQLAARQAAQANWTGPLPSSPAEVLDQVIDTAAAYLGIPYQWGGKRPSTGLDCSGLTKWVYGQHGVELAHWSRHQAQMGAPVALADIQKGDLVAFGSPVHHVGIYIGEGKFIHAPRTGDVVRIQPLSVRDDLSAVRRFPLAPRVGPPAFG